MKVLLTNDDGIDAPGLASLCGVLDGEVYVAAPLRERSGCGHQVTTDGGIGVVRRGECRVAVDGTPADCVRLGLRGGLFGGVVFDWVLSGVNDGGNLGVDVHISGTVAGAREGAILGCRAAAFSYYRRGGGVVDWGWVGERVRVVFDELCLLDGGGGRFFWNVNLPDRGLVSSGSGGGLGGGSEEGFGGGSVGHVFCSPCRNALPVVFERRGEDFFYEGVYASRCGEEGSDVAVCFGGRVAVSRIGV